MSEPTETDHASFYVTTPIYYVNDAPHIGHAYTTAAADVLARWRRQRGDDVWFLTGVDEHGTKVAQAAEAGGVTPQKWVDRLVGDSWLPMLDTIDAMPDDVIRTTSERHRIGVQRFWECVRDAGHVYAAPYEGTYCVACEEFKFPGDLVAGAAEYEGQLVCAIHGRPVEQLSEDNWFFRLSAFQDDLLAHYEAHPLAVEPASAYNEVVSFIKQGLTDISMSRSSVSWGIPLPWDDRQVVYVWFDALLNYATAVGFGSDDPELARRFERVWPADVHLVGKDILRFHAVYWPAMLMAAGLPLPDKVFAHGWLLVGGEKMSKTKLTGIAPATIVDHFGSDAFRYYFLRAIAFGSDGSFSWEDMTARYNAELANGLGNLASRATAMVVRYRDGVLPACGDGSPREAELQELLVRVGAEADDAFLRLNFSTGIAAIRSFVEAVNGYVSDTEPWALAKDPDRAADLDTVLYTVCEALRAIAVLYNAVTPVAAQTIWAAIGAAESLGDLDRQSLPHALEWGLLPAGAHVEKTAALFPRLEDPVGSS